MYHQIWLVLVANNVLTTSLVLGSISCRLIGITCRCSSTVVLNQLQVIWIRVKEGVKLKVALLFARFSCVIATSVGVYPITYHIEK